ncbi:MAG: helix-turn-helix domain-containing protein [Acidobacteria bacterium]|nr:helix-turn-helix domain-containing protein [Acidobacteriota bacterium]
MILRLAEGHSSAAVARQMRVHIQTLSKWRERFHSQGVDGLLDELTLNRLLPYSMSV